MFKEKFNEEMQKIKATDERKAKLLSGIEVEQEKAKTIPYKKPVKQRWIAAVAATVALVIVSVTAFNLPIFSGNNITDQTDSKGDYSQTASGDEEIVFPVFNHQNGIPANVSYNQIYQLFSAIYKSQQKKYTYYTTGTEEIWLEDEAVVDEEYIDNDGAMPGGKGDDLGSVKGENTTAKPESAVDTGNEDFSTTNTQVEDVDEADIVKTDGKYIYILDKTGPIIKIVKPEKGKMDFVNSIFLGNTSFNNLKNFYNSEMYVVSNRLVIIYENIYSDSQTIVDIYDISDPENPAVVRKITQSGSPLSSRVIGNKLYIFTNQYIYEKPIEGDTCSYVPCTTVDAERTPINESDIYMFDGEINRSYLTAISVDITSGTVVDRKAALGGGSQLYANTKSIYVTADRSSYSYAAAAGTPELATKYEHATRIMRFAINGGKITAVAEGTVEGSPLNQFSMDEHNGYFRIVTTKYDTYTTTNAVYVLDSELKIVGEIEDIAKDERVYSVRFMGDTGYFVTFRQVDPLFAVDLSNPQKPKILSALKIPGFSNYLHPWKDGLLLGLGSDADEKTGAVGNVKLSMFNISDPENVTESHKLLASDADSTVGHNHKAVLVSEPRNLIAFTILKEYCVYSYNSKSGFELKASLRIPSLYDVYYYGDATRGIYIGDYLYICNYNGIISYNLSDFSEVDSLVF